MVIWIDRLASMARATSLDGTYLVEYDPTMPGVGPRGEPMSAHITVTTDPSMARRFTTSRAAEAYWRKPSGEPYPMDRPLTAYTVEVVTAPLPRADTCEEMFYTAVRAGKPEDVKIALLQMAAHDKPRAQLLLVALGVAMAATPARATRQCFGCGRTGGELTENGCPICGPGAEIS